jgi:tRNA (adenine37-N6)-methyltransferase
MKEIFETKAIGKVKINKGFAIEVKKEYLPALKNIDGFSHLQIVWWGNKSDSDEERGTLIVKKPYKSSPDELGVFATRSPFRPNPILISTVAILNIDYEKGIINLPYIDADNDTPVLDIKAYHLMERVKECSVPDWCKHWADSYEASATFDWANEFNF